MKKIGITGGIGSGKSAVATMFEIMGIPVYSADNEAKRLTATLPVIREKLTGYFGDTIYNDQGLNKALLAELIFENEDNLRLVNSIIHPEVYADFVAWTTKYEYLPFVAMEAAILFESGFAGYMDITIAVFAPLEIRIERVLKRDNTVKESVISRVKSQMQDEEKCRLSDFMIVNDGKQAIIPQVEKIILNKNAYFCTR